MLGEFIGGKGYTGEQEEEGEEEEDWMGWCLKSDLREVFNIKSE